MARMSQWRVRLRNLRVRRVVFAGGSFSLHPPEDAVQYVGRDYVAIVRKGRIYLIPFGALRKVSGTPQKARVRVINMYLRQQIKRWVDPAINPDAPDQIIWNPLIGRNGREYRGAIIRVSRHLGIRLRLRRQRLIWLRWKQLGAATEILE